MRKVGAAFAVLLLHVLAIRALLVVRVLLNPVVEDRQAVTTWIVLPPESVPANNSAPAPSRSAVGLPMTPFVGEYVSRGIASQQPIKKLPPLIPPVLTVPLVTPLKTSDAIAFSALREYFSCNVLNYDRVLDADRERCALRLSNLGDVIALPYAYTDTKETPFTIFGARGTFAITPPAERSFDLLQTSIGCTWERGFCRLPQPSKFGLDPDDQTRLTAAAKFELAKGLSLHLGAQAFMQDYLGGARLIYAAGVVVSYRW